MSIYEFALKPEWCFDCVCVRVLTPLTKHSETGRAGSHGCLDSLALKHGIVHQLRMLDS